MREPKYIKPLLVAGAVIALIAGIVQFVKWLLHS